MDQPNGVISSVVSNQYRISSHLTKLFFRYVIPLGCLVWVFYDIHFEKLTENIAVISWGWIVLAIFFDILSYVCQGVRWELLLRPVGKISWLKTTQAIYAGLFANEILPMRFGELVRTYLVSHWTSVRFVSIIPSLVVERLFDGIWLALSVIIVAFFFPLPKKIVEGANILGILALIGTALFIFIIFHKEKALAEQKEGKVIRWKPLRIVSSLIEKIAVGLQSIGLSRPVYVAFFYSFLILVFQAIAFWLVMVGYHFDQSFWKGAIVFLIVHLGTAIPNAPSNVGTYQFFTVVGLSLFGVDKTLASGFSVIVFLILTAPLWLIGLFAIMKSGMTFHSIRQQIGKLLLQLKTESKDNL